MAKIKTIVVLYMVTAACHVFGQYRQPPWKEYVFAEDGFAITLQYPPARPHPDAGMPDMTVYTVPVGLAEGKLSLRVSHRERDCSAVLGQLKDGALRGESGARAASFKEVAINGIRGVEYEDNLNRYTVRSNRYYCVNGRLYIFTFTWPSNRPKPAAVAKILKSFRLLPPK